MNQTLKDDAILLSVVKTLIQNSNKTNCWIWQQNMTGLHKKKSIELPVNVGLQMNGNYRTEINLIINLISWKVNEIS